MKMAAMHYFGFMPYKIKFFWDRQRVNWQLVTHISELKMFWRWWQAPSQRRQLISNWQTDMSIQNSW